MLVQRQTTSLDPTALQRVLSTFGGTVQVQPVRRANGDPYLHAKLIIVKQRQRAVCLQGSPNLSQAALLLTNPQGNIELANLLIGARDTFDDLLGGLEVDPPVQNLASLNTSYQVIAPTIEGNNPLWELTAASWNGSRLRIEYRGRLPNLSDAAVMLGQHEYVVPWKVDDRAVECILPNNARAMLDRPIAVRIHLADASETNPIFICNTVALDVLLSIVVDDTESLRRVGGLDLDDYELETLLGLLDDALILDQRSVWQTAGQKPPATNTNEGDTLNLRYSDIDYAMLRRHPRVQQYLRGLSGTRAAGQTRLQVILNAISGHFLEILDRATQTTPTAVGSALVSTTDLREEELEDEDSELAQRSWSQQQRTQRLLKAFIRRYLHGVTSADFRGFAGVEVLAQNFIIFSHILWRIWVKGWVDADFLIEAMLTTWTTFFGTEHDSGALNDVDPAVRVQIDSLLREHHTISTLLAALFDSAYVAQNEGWEDLQLALRDFWRAFLERHAGIVTPTSQNTQRVALYEVPSESGVFWNRQTKQQTEIARIAAASPSWSTTIKHLRQLAAQLKVTMHLPTPQALISSRSDKKAQ
jgi:hypothetical protein